MSSLLVAKREPLRCIYGNEQLAKKALNLSLMEVSTADNFFHKHYRAKEGVLPSRNSLSFLFSSNMFTVYKACKESTPRSPLISTVMTFVASLSKICMCILDIRSASNQCVQNGRAMSLMAWYKRRNLPATMRDWQWHRHYYHEDTGVTAVTAIHYLQIFLQIWLYLSHYMSSSLRRTSHCSTHCWHENLWDTSGCGIEITFTISS